MDIYDKIYAFKKKTITKSELSSLLSAKSDEELYYFIEELTKSDVLSPIVSSHTNGNRVYPIYLKYRISSPQSSYEVEQAEILALHPGLQAANYLQKHPDEYRKYKMLIKKLDWYLFHLSKDKTRISRKERSFEIFDEEKILDDRTFCQLLMRLGFDSDKLLFYDTPEYCFYDYIPKKKSEMTLLICENKDIWFNIRRMMFEEKCSVLFGNSIDGVVYGCGNQISKAEALTSYTAFLGDTKVNYTYWGDIDRAGLNIFQSLQKANPEINIKLFVPGYEEMLKLSENRMIPDSKDGRELMGDYSAIYALFANDLREKIKKSILDNKRIPQEIINYRYLKKHMR